MRILNVSVQINQPHSEDIVTIQDDHLNVYDLTGKQIEEVLIENDQLCPECFGSGEVEEGEHDNIITKKCVCQEEN